MMKKVLCVLLVLTMMLPCFALADGAMYNKDINFGAYTLGSTTYKQALDKCGWVTTIQFPQEAATTRYIADAMGDIYGSEIMGKMSSPACINAALGSQEVAGLYANVEGYFVQDGTDTSLDNFLLYAGAYRFQDNPEAAFDSLKGKLQKVYGEPFMVTTDSNAIWGDVLEGIDDPEGRAAERLNQVIQNEASNISNCSYVVWKSSTNDVMVVLRIRTQWGNTETHIFYLWPQGDELVKQFIQTDDVANDGSDSLEGL